MNTLNLGIRAHDLGQLDLQELCEQLKSYQFTNIQFAIKNPFQSLSLPFKAYHQESQAFLAIISLEMESKLVH